MWQKKKKNRIETKHCSPKVTRIMSILGLNIRLKIPYTPCTGERSLKFRDSSLLFPKRHFNTCMWIFYGSARDGHVTTRTIFCMCCDMYRFYLWFTGVCPWWSSQTRKGLTQGNYVSSAGSAERCEAGYQMISLFNVSVLLNVKHVSGIM